MPRRPWPASRLVHVSLAVLAFAAVIWLLRATAIVSMPLAAAFFVSILLRPVQLGLRDRLPRRLVWLSLPVTMLVLVAVLAGAGGLVAFALDELAEVAPRYGAQMSDLARRATAWADFYRLPASGDLLTSERVQQRLADVATGSFQAAWGLVTSLVIIFFLVLLMLLEAGTWREKLLELVADRHAGATLATLDTISDKVRQYMLVRTVVSALSALASAAWLWLMGVDLVVLWAVLIFGLNYIPNLGSVIGVIPPSLLALVQFGPGQAVFTIAGLTAIEQVLGNFVDPRLQGRRLEISPLVVLVSLLFWGWLWGIAGALLAVPLTATLLVVCAHVPALEPVALFFGRTTDDVT